MKTHDIHDFLNSSQQAIAAEYARIRKRASEDPGTAGDQGEENWATLLKGWLPSYFHVVTKGRILTESGYTSPQVDVIVLVPSYPNILLDKKLYLSGGVAAAFECKTTLKAEHVKTAVQTAADLRRNLPKRPGTPYKELNSTIIFGIVAHSHSWKGEKSAPIENIGSALWAGDSEYVTHPIQCIDFITVADLATWEVTKYPYFSPSRAVDPPGSAEARCANGGHAITSYLCYAMEEQPQWFSPLGPLLSGLYWKLARTFTDMRALDTYFRGVQVPGIGGHGRSRKWDALSIYSTMVGEKLLTGEWSKENRFDEWSIGS
jgi:hypothetical protein